MNTIAYKVAHVLLDIKAVGFTPHNPITFKSGIVSPMYIDNRTLPFYPDKWEIILHSFREVIHEKQIDFDVVAGIESAGIPHSATLGYLLKKPSVFCRKQAKDYGTKKLIEGGSVENKSVLLVEDLVTTGGSSIKGVKALLNEGAKVSACLAIVSYEFPESIQSYAELGVSLYTLTSINVILELAVERALLNQEQYQLIRAWTKDPWTWKPQ